MDNCGDLLAVGQDACPSIMWLGLIAAKASRGPRENASLQNHYKLENT